MSFGTLKSIVILILIVHLAVGQAFAETGSVSGSAYFQLKRDPKRERSILLPSIVSFIVPGFDQWWEGQFGSAALYTGLGAGGMMLSKLGKANIDNRYRDLGLQLYFTAGALSVYHCFRSAISTKRPLREYTFLKKDETPENLLAAPLDFSYIGRWSTILPLVTGMAVFFLLAPQSPSGQPATFGDLFYSSGISYMTGVSEELLFRGYLMPILYETTGNATLSVLVSGGASALTHGLRFNHFITALGFGLYSGWVVQQQDWSLGEMIFVHSWLDVMAFLSDFAAHREHAFLKLPPISFRF